MMTIAEYARQHGLPWSTAKKRLAGAIPRAVTLATGLTRRRDPRTVPDEVRARIRELLAAGEKHEWIAHECGVSRPLVSKIAARMRRAKESA